jgi:hypothetical protein
MLLLPVYETRQKMVTFYVQVLSRDVLTRLTRFSITWRKIRIHSQARYVGTSPQNGSLDQLCFLMVEVIGTIRVQGLKSQNQST